MRDCPTIILKDNTWQVITLIMGACVSSTSNNDKGKKKNNPNDDSLEVRYANVPLPPQKFTLEQFIW
jgi:hypothetical protein